MKIRALDHIALLVKDTERSTLFYTQLLNLKVVPRPSHFAFPGAWLQGEGFQIHLIGEVEDGRVTQVHPGYRLDEFKQGYGTHFALEVDDLQAAIQHIQSLGIEVLGGPRPRGDGVQQLYVSDPDGYMVELFEWEKEK